MTSSPAAAAARDHARIHADAHANVRTMLFVVPLSRARSAANRARWQRRLELFDAGETAYQAGWDGRPADPVWSEYEHSQHLEGATAAQR